MKKLLLLVCMASLPFGTAHAAIANGGFEAGLSDWHTFLGTSPSKVNVVSSAVNFAGDVYSPTEGSKMLSLTSNFPWTILYQEFAVSDASTISFDWAFLKGNNNPSLSSGYAGVWIGNSESFSFPNILSFGNYFHDTGWETFSTSVDPGAATIAFFSNKLLPFENSGQLLIDHVQVTAVPEPRISTLMLAGILGLFPFSFYRKRKKAKKTLNLVVN